MNVTVKPLTRKGINSIRRTGYLNVWEGAIRSSKTVVSILAWIAYVSNSPERYFIMSGKTLAALYRNVIGGDFGLLAILGSQATYKRDSEGNRVLVIHTANGDKSCYCFGANDERSYTTLRGLTAGGWYADEVNLHARSFVDEAFKRTVVSSDRKHFWTLNPDNPYHWIYTDFIDKYEQEELPGFFLWHFTLDDNNAITPERKDELKAQHTGIFYRRYILGERCLAEGVIYSMFAEENLYEDSERPEAIELLTTRTIAVDYGTANPCVFLDIYDDGTTIWVDNEYRWDSKEHLTQKTDSQYADDMAVFMGERHCEIVCDPSAASFIIELCNRMFYVTGADNDVIDGIRLVSNLFEKRLIRVHKRCEGLIKELSVYSWDGKAAQRGKEEPIKQMDHGCDALRYYIKTKVADWRTSEVR
jgi:PBSX family phage terminase large subunit